MRHHVFGILAATGVAFSTLLAAADEAKPQESVAIDLSKLSPVVDNTLVPFASLARAVYEGQERDPDTGETVQIRVECVVREKPEKVAGTLVTVVEVQDVEDEEVVETTLDYYAQDADGNVYYLGETVRDFEDGKLVGHGGQWLTGVDGAQPGLFMPATPKVGDVFEQERAPGVAEDRSTVVAVGIQVTVPAGTFENCIETEDFDPIGKSKQRKFYAPGVGLVKEILSDGESTIELVKRESR